jgi:hypothetical protein
MKTAPPRPRPVPLVNRKRHGRFAYTVAALYFAKRLEIAGEPFPLVFRCLSAGIEPRALYLATRAAWRDAAMIE